MSGIRRPLLAVPGTRLSSDGPEHNVLKFKPPMQFNHTDTQLFLATLDRVLTESDPH